MNRADAEAPFLHTQSEMPAGSASLAVGWWTTFVFFIFYTLSFVDRQVLNLLVDPIKQSLGISDFQISLLQGITFSAFYAVFGLGIGWLIDNGPRRLTVCVGIALWSVAAAGCGLATRFIHLVIGRAGVAVGEASLAPAGYSMLSDLFPPRRLALPMSVMGAGASVGASLAYVIGGAVLARYPEGMTLPVLGHLDGWQLVFILIGVPGIAVAPLIFTVPDRRNARRAAPQGPVQYPDPDPASGSPGMRQVLRFIRQHPRFYTGHFVGFGLYSMINYAASSWWPTLMIRHHGWSIEQTAYVVAALVLGVGVSGGLLSGWCVDRWFSRGRRDAHLRFFAIAALLQMISVFAAVTTDDARLCILFAVPLFALTSFTGAGAAALQITTPARMRGQASALYLLVFNLLGIGLGPTVVAFFTDYVLRNEARVGESIALTYLIFAPLTAGLMLWAGPAMVRRLDQQSRGRA